MSHIVNSLVKRLARSLFVMVLTLASLAGHAQDLPALGDEASAELSVREERRLGEQIMQILRKDPDHAQDALAQEYLAALVARLTQKRTDVPQFDVFLVKDPTLNAFALPGGFLGVHTGLILAAQSESELASVMAHEIGHVTQRHIARMLVHQKKLGFQTLAAMVLAALAAPSNPQAAAGLATMMSGAQQQQMLAFSRDAEREADRLGLELVKEANFDPAGMSAFFTRLQQATRAYESNAPGYMRSHPLTAERIGDIQVRLQNERYRQRPDSVDFRLLKARLQALAEPTREALAIARERLTRVVQTRATNDLPAAWYALAVIHLELREHQHARDALAQVRQALAAGHPFERHLAVQVELSANRSDEALALSEQTVTRFPSSLALAQQHGQVLLSAGQANRALEFAKAQQQSHPQAWQFRHLESQSYAALGKTGKSHQAAAELYWLRGEYKRAIEQLQIAQRAKDLDFYAASQVDARLGDFKERWRAIENLEP